jgi:hypothetical protein
MSVPKIQSLGNNYTFEWEQEQVWARVERVYQHTRGEVSAEVMFRATVTDPSSLLHHSMCSNLLGVRSRTPIAKDCAMKDPRMDEAAWLGMVEMCFEYVVTASRVGEPAELLVDVAIDLTDDYLLYPLLYQGHITVLFGLGGTLKSTITAWLANRVALGVSGDAQNVCILDWESTAQAWARRLREVAIGMGDPEPAPNITYRRMTQPIADDIEAVYRIGSERNIGFWIIDSGMWACGGRPEEAEHAMRMFRAIRALGGTCLIIAHQNSDENTKRPYGNVMWVNAPRSVVQVQKSQLTIADNQVVVGLTQRKVNYGKQFKPLGYEATFTQANEFGYTDGDAVAIQPTNPLDDEELAMNVGLTQRVQHALRRGRKSKAELAELLDIDGSKLKSLYSTVDRMARSGSLERVGNNEYALPTGTFGGPDLRGNSVSQSDEGIPLDQATAQETHVSQEYPPTEET